MLLYTLLLYSKKFASKHKCDYEVFTATQLAATRNTAESAHAHSHLFPEQAEYGGTEGAADVSFGSEWVVEKADLQWNQPIGAEVDTLSDRVILPIPHVHRLSIEACVNSRAQHNLIS